MEQLEVVLLNSHGASIRAALRKGLVVVITLRLSPGEWEPLYAIFHCWRVELPRDFCWSIEAIGALEAAAFAPRRHRPGLGPSF
jgi:hypothetical protein